MCRERWNVEITCHFLHTLCLLFSPPLPPSLLVTLPFLTPSQPSVLSAYRIIVRGRIFHLLFFSGELMRLVFEFMLGSPFPSIELRATTIRGVWKCTYNFHSSRAIKKNRLRFKFIFRVGFSLVSSYIIEHPSLSNSMYFSLRRCRRDQNFYLNFAAKPGRHLTKK